MVYNFEIELKTEAINMVEAGSPSSQQLTTLLQGEQDWARAAIFTDTKDIIANRDCNILPDELE